MPKITVRICEFDSDLPLAALFRIDRHYPAFALFLGEAINDEDLLAEFYARLHVGQPTVTAHCHRRDVLTEIRISVGKKFKAYWQCLYHRIQMFFHEIYRATKPKFLHLMFRLLSSLESPSVPKLD